MTIACFVDFMRATSIIGTQSSESVGRRRDGDYLEFSKVAGPANLAFTDTHAGTQVQERSSPALILVIHLSGSRNRLVNSSRN